MTTDLDIIHREADEATNVSLDDLDPDACWRDFAAAWQRYSSASVTFRSLPHSEQRKMWTARMANKWSSTRSAFGTFLRSLSPNERRKMWKMKKVVQTTKDESHLLWLVVLYEREKDRLRASTEKGRARQARYDGRRANDPERRAKLKEYRARNIAKNSIRTPRLRIVK